MKVSYPYHILQNSPWPFLISFNLLSFLLRFILTLSPSVAELGSPPVGWGPFGMSLLGEGSHLFLRFFILLLTSFLWFLNIFQENKIGFHTIEVSKGLFLGLFLFILSEVSLFFSFFFSFFYNSLIPDPSVGSIWPPFSISPLNFLSVPLLNTFILITSGFSLTAAHHSSFFKFPKETFKASPFLIPPFFSPLSFGLLLTIFLGFIFSFLQLFEYFSTSFTFSDSVYGSSFFILTGTHGLHIIIGSFFLLFSFFLSSFSFSSPFSPSSFGSSEPNSFLSFASLYWHFVDLVWLFLFFFLYCL